MTIRKISGRTTSLAVKATVTQGGIFKAALQNPTGIQSLQNKSSTLIPKIANVTHRVINHLLYDPDGFGIRHVYDWLSIDAGLNFSLNKSQTDTVSASDVLISRVVKNREPADSFSTTEYLNFLLRTRRTFDDAAVLLDTPSLGLHKPVADTQSFTDFFFISRVKNFDETITGSDTFGRIFNTSRNFEDTVGMLDAFVFIDGSTFELRRRLYDAVTVNTSDVELVRNAGNSTENFSYVMNKYLDPDMELLDQIAKLGLKSITDVDIRSADRTFLYAAKPLTDTAAPADTQPVFVGLKSFTDTETLIDGLIQFGIAKLLADTTTMLDSMSFGDQLTYDSTKLLSDILTETDRPYLWFAPATKYEDVSLTDANRGRFIKANFDSADLAETSTKIFGKNTSNILTETDRPYLWFAPANKYDDVGLADANRGRFIKANFDSADLAETSTKIFGKNTSNILSLADILNITRLRDYADEFTTTDLNRFALTKLFADTVVADDPLIRLSDGNISYLIKQNRSNQPIYDDYAPAVRYYRYPHHGAGGLGNFVPVLEKDTKFITLRARAGALTTYPIIRTNLIAWSEQFDTYQSGGYWTSIGATVTTNATLAPQNVISSNSTTYDADQLQELFYNKPNNVSYGRSWYQIVPGRWVMSSDGDLLKQDTSTGTHQLTTPNIPELFSTNNFSFAIYLKYAGHRYVRLGVTSLVNVDVDMVNNVVIATNAVKASMQPVGGGWFLVELENLLVPDIISSARILLLNNSLNTTFTGNGTDGVYVWGAQLEVGDQPEQEISSLKYIRTAGGSATRIGFSVTPTDNDRVFVGRIQRRGNNVGNDPNEIINLLVQFKVPLLSNLTTPVDYAARSVRYFRNSIIVPGLGLSIAAGNGNSLRRYSNDPLELISFWFNKDAKKAGTSTATRQTVVRQNLLKWSERFDYDYWNKNNVLATTGVSVIGGSLPYRNVVYDADQIHGLFYNKKYTYNQGRRWWDVTPLSTATRADFTSNTIVDIFESSSNSIHTVQTFGFATNLSGDFFASSIYASPANGVTRFRLQVGSVFADFDLSSIAVLSSVGTLYNKIVQADTSTGWYLCTIIGPTQALGTLNFTTDTAIPADLLQKLLLKIPSPDNQSIDDLRFNYVIKGFADTTTMLSNFYIADGSTYTGNKQLLDSFVAGTLEGFRTSGNQAENVKFLTKFVAHRAGEFTSLTIKLINDVKGSAVKVAEDVFVNRTNKTWFQLAPYYNSSVHIDDYPTDYDRVRIGTQSGGVRSSSDPFETFNILMSRYWVNRDSSTATDVKTRQFIDKHIDETKLIPTIPKFDAAAVAGLFYNTTRNIDGRRYTPQDGNYVYYKKTDWYSLAPRYARPRFALGTANTPGTIMIDNMSLGDSLTYYQNYHLYDYLLIGSPDGVRGTSDNENFSYNLNMRPRRGAFTDLYVAKSRPTKFDADQTAGIFWGSSNSTTSYTKLNPYGKRWFQLAPYYASYEHFKDSPGQYDFVRVGSVRGGQRHLGWPTEIMSLGMLKTPYETSVTADVRSNWFNLTAKISTTSDYTGYYLNRINLVTDSENLFNSSWTKSAVSLSTGSVIQSGALPFRNISLDADQVNELFYNGNINNNYGKRWYQLVPSLRNRPNYTSTLVNVIVESSSNTQHYVETLINKSVTSDAWFAFSTYVRVQSGANRFRLSVDGQSADFRISTESITASSAGIYARIRNIDSSTNTYLVNILGASTNTSFVARVQLLNSAGNTSYAGNTSVGLYVWGTQFEVSEYYNELRNDVDNFRYLRSRGETSYRLAVRFGADSRTDFILVGQDQDARLGGSSKENVSFLNKFVAHRSGDATSILITLGSITRTSADQTAEVFDNIKTSTPIMNKWYQLAPYYRSSLYNRPTDYDLVRVGSQTLSKRTSSDPYETLSFWLAPKPLTDSSTATDIKTAQFVRKEFSETRMIPNNPRFDAARVAGIDLVSSGAQRINLKTYTPIAGSTTYYKSWDWFSLAPLSNRAIYALGNAGAGPIMLDNMSFGDNLTYTGTKLLSSINVTVGTQLTSVNLSYAPTLALPVISSTVTTAGTEGNLIPYSKQLDQWTAISAAVQANYAPANPDPMSFSTADQITLLTNASSVRQALSRNISAGIVCNFTVWIKVTNNAFAFKFGLQVSGVDYGIQINNPVAPTALTQNGAGVTPIAVSVTSNGYYRYSFNISTPTNLTPANTNIILSGTGAGAGTQILGVWGWSLREFRSTPVTLGQEVTTTSTAIEYAASSISVTYTYPTSTADPINIGTKYGNDPRETTDVRLNKTAKQAAFTDLYVKNRRISPLDADQVHGILFNSSNSVSSIIRNNPYQRAWYQLAPYYASFGHVKQSPDDLDRVLVSYKELFQPWLIKTNTDTASTTGDGGTRKQTGQLSLETTRLDVQLFARRSALTTSNVLITTKTNWVSYSEDFTGFYWGKTNAQTVQAPQLMSGRYPYRNTNYDAVQVANQFMLISTSSAFTRYNNYYRKAWYTPAPITNRVAFSSTVLQYLTDQDAFGPHYMQAEVQLRDYSIPEEWVTYSLHVQRQAGVRRFRMDVGRCYADFDLSSVSVVTSTQTVRYANIRYVDTSAGVFLCQIIAPIQTFPNTLIRFAVSSDTITAADSGINFLFRDKRTFNDAVVGTESINNDKTTDYHL